MLAERYDASALLLVHRLVCKTACCKALLLPGEAKTIENGKHVLSSQRRTADGACTKRKPRRKGTTCDILCKPVGGLQFFRPTA